MSQIRTPMPGAARSGSGRLATLATITQERQALLESAEAKAARQAELLAQRELECWKQER